MIMVVSKIYLLAAAISVVIIAVDLTKHPQPMRIMNAVWILTAIWLSMFAVVAYFWFGRAISKGNSPKS